VRHNANVAWGDPRQSLSRLGRPSSERAWEKRVWAQSVCKWWACLCGSGTNGAAFDGGIGAGVDVDIVLCTARDHQNPQSTQVPVGESARGRKVNTQRRERCDGVTLTIVEFVSAAEELRERQTNG